MQACLCRVLTWHVSRVRAWGGVPVKGSELKLCCIRRERQWQYAQRWAAWAP